MSQTRKTLTHVQFANLCLEVKKSEDSIREKLKHTPLIRLAEEMDISDSALRNALRANGIPFGRSTKESSLSKRVERLEADVKLLLEKLSPKREPMNGNLTGKLL